MKTDEEGEGILNVSILWYLKSNLSLVWTVVPYNANAMKEIPNA
jgi:hypothetical protein